jgi:hypothetical protein
MNITDEERLVIKSKLPNLDELLFEGESKTYERGFVSTLEHWTVGEEVDEIFPIDPIEISDRQHKFKNLINHLYESTPIYTARFRRDRRNNLSIKKIRNSEILNKKCQFHMLNEDYGDVFRFILPEYSLVYTQNYDWTHLIDYCNKEQCKSFRNLIEKFGLNWLE